MPYASKKQQGYFHANVGKKGITKKMVSEYDNASRGIKLPTKKMPKQDRRGR